MIRLIGAITGSALAIATLLVVVGIPQFRAEDDAAEQSVMRLPRPTLPVEDADSDEPPAPAAPHRQPEAVDAAGPEPGERPGPDRVSDDPALVAVASRTGSEAGARSEPGDAATRPGPAARPETGWYPFWSPFNSRIAAEGFVERLQSVTGLDYRIVETERGAWEVGFAYDEDDDILAHLSQISAATGLKLPERP